MTTSKETFAWCAWHPAHGWRMDNIAGVELPALFGSKADAIEDLSWLYIDEAGRQIKRVKIVEIEEE